jgi:opacity protein-like surface antigen
MKQTLLICTVFCLVISASASAQSPSEQPPSPQMWDFTGQTWATGHLGYAFGMGSAFSSYTEPYTNTEFSSGPGVGFGGQFYYGLKHNLLIGGELMFQSYTFKMSAPPNLALGFPGMDVSETQTEVNLIANALYAVKQNRNSALFLMGGTGLYDFGGTKLGINTGLVGRKQVSDNVYLFGMPRLHVVLTDNTPMMIQLTMGAQFSLGG